MPGVWLITLIILTHSQQLLNNIPITFSLGGTVSYIPTAGGVSSPGYSFTLGFDKYQWIGIQFRALTSSGNYDTLILQRSTTPSSGVYTASIKDYYVSSGRPSTLMQDLHTSLDKIVTTTSDTSSFLLTMPRTTANTFGEDWQGGEFVDICFFTSDITFSESTWSMQYQICYGYQAISYVSTLCGIYITNMSFQGEPSKVYGAIYGPYLQVQLFWYRPNSTLSNTSALIIQIGDRINSFIGYDYYQCGVGDSYGNSPTAIQKDLPYSGYDDGACSVVITSTSVMLSYSRYVYTYDDFDNELSISPDICLIGAQTSCSNLQLTINYPIMSVASALTIYEAYLHTVLLLGVTLFFIL